MKFSTYIFDLDGTLLDTLGDLAASVNYALRTCDMPEHSIEDVRSFVGNGVRLLMERAVPDGVSNPRFDEAFSTFRQHYLAHSLDTTKPYDGILEMLAALKANGCRMAVVRLVNMRLRASVRNRHPIPSLRLSASLGWGRKVPSMWVIAMWISRLPGIAVCLVSVYSGVSAIVTSC